ncbi:MAG: S41 family peptidase, partial [Bacteroidota bacterium]
VLLREEIQLRNVTYAGFVEPGIGYIRLERFSRTAGDDIRRALKDLKVNGSPRGLILDLRDNPGGLLEMAVDVVSKFVPESSLVVSTRGRRPDSERKYYSNEKPMLVEGPLAVLINRGSASASEIVAGALQDLDRGIIVGTRSFGKGLVQTVTRLTENSSLKITTGRYYTPSGRSIQELDYLHRDSDGRASVLPDSLRRQFRTAHNRPVFEGAGITPDATVDEAPRSRLFEELNRKAMIFKFANRYVARRGENAGPPAGRDVLLADFSAFLKEKEFAYQEEGELKLSELRTIAQERKYGGDFAKRLQDLGQVLEAEKKKSLQVFDDAVRMSLEMEIIARLKGDRARIEAGFAGDRQLGAAIALIKDPAAYDHLLLERRR